MVEAPPLPPPGFTEQDVFRALIDGMTLERMALRNHGTSFNGNRDLNATLGYPDIVTTEQCVDAWERGGIAGRIVDVGPDATWRGTVELIEDASLEDYTPFEQSWADFDQALNVTSTLRRADKLAGLSTFSILLIGVRNGGDLTQELPNGKPGDVIYLTPFLGGGGSSAQGSNNATLTGSDASVYEYDVDPASERFGLPLTYTIKRVDARQPSSSVPVHWSRVCHFAHDLLRDDVFGQPTLRRVWNLLVDLWKVTGGGAEAFWLRANQGVHLNIDPKMELADAEAEKAALAVQSQKYADQLTRWIRTRGVDVKTLGSDVANFEPSADAILTQIAGARAIPKRILTGSEMGELASSQDRENWRDQVNGRRSAFAGPSMVKQLASRLIAYGYLLTPKGGPLKYDVRFEELSTHTEQEKSAGAKAWADTKVNEQPVFTDAEIRDKWYGMAPLTDEQRAEMAAQAQPAAPLEASAEDAVDEVLELAEADEEPADEDVELRAAGGVGSGVQGHETPEERAAREAAAAEHVKQAAAKKTKDGAEKKVKHATPEAAKNAVKAATKKLEAAGFKVVAKPSANSVRLANKLGMKIAMEVGKDNAVTFVATKGRAQIRAAEHAHATTQIQLPPRLAGTVLAFPVADEDLAEKGRELDPHVTVKYGVTDPPGRIARVVQGFGPVTFSLGPLAAKEAEDHDVLYATVLSPDLVALNALISAQVAHVEDTHPRYVPHVTVAYLKLGAGAKYAGRKLVDDTPYVADVLTYSDADDDAFLIPLTVVRSAARASIRTITESFVPQVARKLTSLTSASALRDSLAPVLRRALLAGAAAGVQKLSARGIDVEFDPVLVEPWLAEHVAASANGIAETSASIVANGSDPATNERVAMIAQAEAHAAVSQGQRIAWQAAAEPPSGTRALAKRRGFIEPRRMWLSMTDACEQCEEMDGKTARIYGKYSGGVEGPPFHVGCLCEEDLVDNDEE